VLMDNPLF